MKPAAKKRVLFICIHNSARSQMAEAWLNAICGDEFEAHSAGLEPGVINPLTIEVMREQGIDLSRKGVHSVFEVYKSGKLFSYVITVCDESSAEKCPIFPGPTKRLHWSFPDPSVAGGTHEQRLTIFRNVRDLIRDRVQRWCDEICQVARPTSIDTAAQGRASLAGQPAAR